MKQIHIITILAVTVLFGACTTQQQKRDKAVKDITNFEAAHDPFGLDYIQNPASGDSLIALYTSFANTYPDDSLAPSYLLSAAKVAVNTGNYDQTIEFTSKVISEYGDGFEGIKDCYQTKAIACEAAGNYELEKSTYQEFIEQFPDDPMVPDYKKYIHMLEKGYNTPEEQLNAILSGELDEN